MTLTTTNTASMGRSSSSLASELPRVTKILFALCFVSAITLNLSSAVAVPGILGCIAMTVLLITHSARIYNATLYAILLNVFALLSAFVFGGIQSINTSGPITWLGGEGRFFLYYWPFIFITLAMREAPESISRAIERILGPITIVAVLAIVAKQAVGIKLYSSHHGAGAFMSALVIFNAYRYGADRRAAHLAYLFLAVGGLLGTGSRTSLLAVLLGLLAQQIVLFRFKTLIFSLAAAPLLALLMFFLFPQQYNRLSNTFSANPLRVIESNFQRAWSADPPLESATAWSLADLTTTSVQANLAIRGVLWARGMSEGARSPLVGTGFGSFNDTGRHFSGAQSFLHVVVDAEFRNPSSHSSHNGFIMVFTEMGLIGLGLTLAIGLAVVRKSLQVLRNPRAARDARMWASVGLGCVVVLAFASITQHAFGAPIYGLTLLQLIAVSYGRNLGELNK